MRRFLSFGVAVAALGAPPALALPGSAALDAAPAALVQKVDAWCGPGYHIGRGGRRCWPNGRAPAEEIPVGYVVPRPLPAYVANPPPVLECPAGFHLGRGLRRCWPD